MTQRTTLWKMRFNLAQHFVDRHVQEGRGDKTAIRCEGREFTYADVLAQVNRVGNGLRQSGVQTQDRVLLILPDGPEFVAAYFGAAKIGAVAVPSSTFLRSADYSYFLDESRARVLIVDSGLRSIVEPALAGSSQVITTGEQWERWLAAQSAELEAAPTSENDPAFWLWTSGSTGSPKAAVHRHQDWLHCCRHYACGVLGIGATDVTFSSSKLFHAYGLGNGLLFPFYVGATTVLYPGKPTSKTILAMAQEARPTLFFSVPTLFAAMLQESPCTLDSIRLGVSAAEPLPAEICRRWHQRFGFPVLDGIGSTEVLHIYISSRPDKIKPGSSGLPVPGYEIRVTDEKGRDLPAGAVGDLWVRGPSTATCYWNRPEITAERMRDGWFFTGDKYSVDEDGYYWYAGRSDDMFRVGGEWVSPVEVEAALMEHPAVLECAVVPQQDSASLLKPKAYVILKPGWTPGPELTQQMRDFVKQRIAPYKYPRVIEFLEELPKTATGKIQRYRLRG